MMITRNDGKSSIDGKGHAVQPCGLAALNVTFAQILTNFKVKGCERFCPMLF
jgi:hypothetical protein